MNNFVPKSKSCVANQLKNLLLNGYIIRYSIEEVYVEVIGRDYINKLVNLRIHESEMTKIVVPTYILFEIIEDLKKDYILQRVHCNSSGSFKDTYYAIYLE